MTILSGTLADAGKTVSAYVQLDINLSSTTPDPGTSVLLDQLKHAVGGTLRINPAVSGYLVTAVNPDPAPVGFPGGRGPDKLVLFCAPVVRTVTNKWGVEVAFDSSGAAVQCIDRRAVAPGSSADVGLLVPAGGFIASGNGAAADWLKAAYQANAEAMFIAPHVQPPQPPPPPGPGTVRTVGPWVEEWVMEWPGNGGPVSSIPASTNVLSLAFLQGSGQPVGWGSESQAQLAADLTAFRSTGRAVMAGVGGSGGAVNTSNRDQFVAHVLAYRTALGGQLDGLTWDIEASGVVGDDIFAINSALAAAVPGWQTEFCPNGGNIGDYLPIAVRHQQAGLLTRFGQQFYDAAVSVLDAEGRITEAIAHGIPVEKYMVGMMIAPDDHHWPLQECHDNMATILAKWPTIGGAFLWHSGRDQADQWSAAMRGLLG